MADRARGYSATGKSGVRDEKRTASGIAKGYYRGQARTAVCSGETPNDPEGIAYGSGDSEIDRGFAGISVG